MNRPCLSLARKWLIFFRIWVAQSSLCERPVNGVAAGLAALLAALLDILVLSFALAWLVAW